jgi:hypothetical protein
MDCRQEREKGRGNPRPTNKQPSDLRQTDYNEYATRASLRSIQQCSRIY